MADGSFLEADEPNRVRRLCSALHRWWLETTDVVILNSPWLRRSTGRAFRSMWMCLHLAWWCSRLPEASFRRALKHGMPVQIGLSVMLLCFASVAWASFKSKSDTIVDGLLFSVGLLSSFAVSDSLRIYPDGMVGHLGSESHALSILTLCHCNVHPIGLVLVFGFGFAAGAAHETSFLFWHGDDKPYHLAGRVAYRLLAECLILCAFTADFTMRVGAVSSGMIYGSGGLSNADDVLQSPVAGRTSRKFCWLAGVSSWSCLLLYLWTSRLDTTGISWMSTVFCLLVVSLLMLVGVPRLSALHSDIMLALLCHVPPTLLALDLYLCLHKYGLHGKVWLPPVPLSLPAWLSQSQLSHLLASQTLIQAGCHPFVCAGFASISPLQFAYFCTTIRGKHNWHTIPVTAALVFSHRVDYFERVKAIKEGIRRSEENASRVQFVATHGMEMETRQPQQVSASGTESDWQPQIGADEEAVWDWVDENWRLAFDGGEQHGTGHCEFPCWVSLRRCN